MPLPSSLFREGFSLPLLAPLCKGSCQRSWLKDCCRLIRAVPFLQSHHRKRSPSLCTREASFRGGNALLSSWAQPVRAQSNGSHEILRFRCRSTQNDTEKVLFFVEKRLRRDIVPCTEALFFFKPIEGLACRGKQFTISPCLFLFSPCYPFPFCSIMGKSSCRNKETIKIFPLYIFFYKNPLTFF